MAASERELRTVAGGKRQVARGGFTGLLFLQMLLLLQLFTVTLLVVVVFVGVRFVVYRLCFTTD